MRYDLNVAAQFLVGKQPIRFNQHENVVHMDVAPEKLIPGNHIILDAYAKVDPDTYTDVWGDRWLQLYATALIMRQWGRNLSKFANVKLPGGTVLNGDQILANAKEEVERLEQELEDSYSGLPEIWYA